MEQILPELFSKFLFLCFPWLVFGSFNNKSVIINAFLRIPSLTFLIFEFLVNAWSSYFSAAPKSAQSFPLLKLGMTHEISI